MENQERTEFVACEATIYRQKAVLVVSKVEVGDGKVMPLCHSVHLSRMDAKNAISKIQEQPDWLRHDLEAQEIEFCFAFDHTQKHTQNTEST